MRAKPIRELLIKLNARWINLKAFADESWIPERTIRTIIHWNTMDIQKRTYDKIIYGIQTLVDDLVELTDEYTNKENLY